MNYQLIALDMDGTLLNHELKITKSNLDAMKKAKDADKYVVISTGRSLSEMKHYLDDLTMVRYMILESGACVYDLYEHQMIYQKTFSKDDILKIYNTLQKQDIMLHIFTNGYSYSPDGQRQRMDEYQMGKYQNMFLECVEPIMNVELFFQKHMNHVEKVNFYHRSTEEREKSLQSLKDLAIVKACVEISSLELTPKGVNKGLGIEHLCDYLNISTDQCIAVGDSDNDLEMLDTVGLAIAMGNANENVKNIADIIVNDCEHDGVVEAINKYLLI
ncbi:Cof-type HAD-IIB family hydrolase [Candidatus Stoquefichus massiliensis]|uniref:Cof-type HAD-IIB family hydrolase n=1 Tax=Candidatus Stoquefichus massiliensis TaxID=1470350 RepID=UPI00048115E0|nr:Cof-type HAD-IIB family hydrolase [Candidatus Stoquefichus massiliensis]